MSANNWVDIAFMIFVILSFMPIKRAVFRVIDDKIESVKGYIQDSERVKDEANVALSEAKYSLECIEEQKGLIIKQANDRARRLRESVELKVTEMTNKRVQMAEFSGEYVKTRALIMLRREIIEQVLNDVAKDEKFLAYMDVKYQLGRNEKLLKKFFS